MGQQAHLQHYAGQVLYDFQSFVDKNREFIPPSHQNLMMKSSNPFVRWLFGDDEAEGKITRPFGPERV